MAGRFQWETVEGVLFLCRQGIRRQITGIRPLLNFPFRKVFAVDIGAGYISYGNANAPEKKIVPIGNRNSGKEVIAFNSHVKVLV